MAGRAGKSRQRHSAIAARTQRCVAAGAHRTRCRGFLRGGVGEIAPEHLLVQRGFATLCPNLNNDVSVVRDASGKHRSGWRRRDAAGVRGALQSTCWRRASWSIRGASARADKVSAPSRFRTTSATATCCRQRSWAPARHSTPGTVFLRAPGRGVAGECVHVELGPAGSGQGPARPVAANFTGAQCRQDPRAFADAAAGKRISAGDAIARCEIRAPLLMQPPESEYLLAMQLHGAISRAGGTVETYVLPDEGHQVGRYPSHQYWRLRRALDWFAFWLQGQANKTPETEAQFARWERNCARHAKRQRSWHIERGEAGGQTWQPANPTVSWMKFPRLSPQRSQKYSGCRRRPSTNVGAS